MHTATAVVIGAGPRGLKAAWALTVHGVKVSVFDRRSVFSHATAALRWMLQRSAAVRVVGRADVVDLLTTADRGVVRGVIVRLRGGNVTEFPADLVIDATGGASGFDLPPGCVGYSRIDQLLTVHI